MIKFEKDGNVKQIDESSSLIPVLLKAGWAAEGLKAPVDDSEKDDLVKQAKALKIKGAHLMSVDKLKEKIAEAA